MKIIIYCFSGTGNTLKVANLYKKYLQEDTTVFQVREDSSVCPNPNEYDIVGIAYPIHGFNMPQYFYRFLKKLPSVNNKRLFILKTSGEGLHLNDCSSQKAIRLLKKKGFNVTLERHIVMPYNMIYRHTDGMAKQMWIYAKALSKINCDEILQNKEMKVVLPIWKKWYAPIFRILWPFTHVHGPLFRVNKYKCIKCNKCIKICPTQNISIIDEKYKFGTKCTLCMGCSFSCPKSAINVGFFRFWKVNGSYNVEKLALDPSIKFPYIDGSETGIYKLYRKYYKECDIRLKNANVNVNDYID
ncbi:MAG: EFR1 family ferrodoxin [Bacillales bacterium]|nr:EFR1 family ferrodoxin [Bacillales bacterium]